MVRKFKTFFVSGTDTCELSNIQEQLEYLQNNQMNQADLAESINGATNSIAGMFTQAASKSLKQNKQPYKRRYLINLGLGLHAKSQGKSNIVPITYIIIQNRHRRKINYSKKANYTNNA